jgi:hypothetical protein
VPDTLKKLSKSNFKKMKFLKSYSASIIIVMVFSATNIFAQSANNIPNCVVTAFAAKYPRAQIKKWDDVNGAYTAKATDGHQKFYATFDQNGNWISTAAKINWSWSLPSEIQSSLRNSKYAAWKIDGIKKVDSPSAGLYQVCLDDHFLHRDGAHALAFTHNKVLNITADGQIIAEKSISSPLLF